MNGARRRADIIPIAGSHHLDWGSGDASMRVAIVFGHTTSLEENLADLGGPGRFDQAELATMTDCGLCMPFENHRMIFLYRGPRLTFQGIWPGGRGLSRSAIRGRCWNRGKEVDR